MSNSHGALGALVLAAVSLTLLAGPGFAQADMPRSPPEGVTSIPVEPDVIFVPTPQSVVEEMLELANVGEDDVVYDLGSGDGRTVITAAKKYGARAVGIEVRSDLIREARANAREAGVADQVEFRQQDLFQTDFSEATAVTLYLLASLNIQLRPELFRQLEPGTPVVSHDFDMGEWEPERVVETEEGSTIYLWTVPEEVPAHLSDGGDD